MPKLSRSILLIIVLMISILSLASCSFGEEQVVLKDIKANDLGDRIEFKLEVENIASSYITVIPEIQIENSVQKISEKILDQYILLPNRTNTITFFYSKSFFPSGDYDIISKLRYEKTSSNILSKTLKVSTDGTITIESKTTFIEPDKSYAERIGISGTENTLLYVIILVLVIGLMAPRLSSLITALKTAFQGNAVVPAQEEMHQTVLGESGESLLSSSSEDTNSYVSGISEEVGRLIESDDITPSSAEIPKSMGRDLEDAVEEEKHRLKEELEDLDRLYDKDILDDDIYLRNKKQIEDKLSRISVNRVMQSRRTPPVMKKEISHKMDERKKKLENSLKMLEKLYGDQLIDDTTFKKNKDEIEFAMKKLDSA